MMDRILFTSCIVAGVLVFTSVANAQNIKGSPGIDYPNYHSIPNTSFKCSEQKYIPGFYADLETNCQVFHFCFNDQQESFLCPTSTTFNQEKLACDSWFASNCTLAPFSYNINGGPAMRNAGKRLPMLLKLRNRSQDKTHTTNLHETLSSLYEGNIDNPLPEGVESSNFSLNASEGSIINDTDGFIAKDISPLAEAESESKTGQSLSEDAQLGLEENFQSDSNGDLSSNIELGFGEDLVYDPVTDGYYIYDPYQEEWQQDPESDEFNTFYDTRDDYTYQDYSHDWDEDEEVIAESSEDMDFNTVGKATDEKEFSKRHLAEQQFKPYRRRPTYVVLEDDESEYPVKVLANEHDLGSSEDAVSETVEVASELPLGNEESEMEETEGIQEFNEDLRKIQFPYHSEYLTENSLALDEFADSVTEFAYEDGFLSEGNEAKSLEDEFRLENEQVEGFVTDETDLREDLYGEEGSYNSSPLEFNLQDNFEGQETDLYSNIEFDQGNYGTKIEEYETEAGSVDTYVVIPEESDADSFSSVDDADFDKTEYRNSPNEYTFEDMGSDVQMDGPQAKEVGDEYEYYRIYRNLPEFPELIDPQQHKLQRPFSHSVYYRPLHNVEGYTHYTPSVAREFLSKFQERNRHSYQGDQPMQVMDPVYGAGNGYVYGNFYDPYGQVSDYYESVEPGYYPSTDDPMYEDSAEDVELENQLGVTDEAFSAESKLENSEETLVTMNSNEDFSDYDGNSDETYYVLDLDEDEVYETNMKDLENETLSDGVHSYEIDADEVFEKSPLESDKQSVSTGKGSFDKESTSFEQVGDFQSNVLGSLDSLLISQSSNKKVPDSKTGAALDSKAPVDSWSSFATESSAIDDKPVTFSSALERLALLNAKATETPGFGNLGFSSDTGFPNNIAFPESMDFGPYGYGANMGQQYMMDAIQAGKQMEAFSHRHGDTEKPDISKLSSIQERLRSMKQGKFGVFKKYMNTMKN